MSRFALHLARALTLALPLAVASSGCMIVDDLSDDVREQSQPVPAGDPAEVLDLVNEARGQARTCGAEGSFGPAGPLGWNDLLGRATQRHAQDMAQNDNFSHTGTDGSTPADRASQEGYDWTAVAENIAAGQSSPQEVVASWVESPGHCANIMNPAYVHMGIARAQGGSYGIYWAQMFARP